MNKIVTASTPKGESYFYKLLKEMKEQQIERPFMLTPAEYKALSQHSEFTNSNQMPNSRIDTFCGIPIVVMDESVEYTEQQIETFKRKIEENQLIFS